MEIKIRAATQADAATIAHIQVDTWRASYGTIVPKTYLAGLSYDDSERFWWDLLSGSATGCVFVAEDKGGVIGFASGRPRGNFSKGLTDYKGVLDTLYVLPSHQGASAGRRLIAAVTEYFLGLDIESMLLWVFAENRAARGFYESLGGVLVAEDGFEIGGAWVSEVAYGWRDVSVLAEDV